MKTTIKERVAVLETEIKNLTEKITNHCGAHVFDRAIQSITLVGMVLIIFLLKIVIFK